MPRGEGRVLRSTFLLSYRVQGELLRMSFLPTEKGEGGIKPTTLINHNYTLCSGKCELNQDVWHDRGYNAVCQYTVISKDAWYHLGGCLREEQEKLSRRPTRSQLLWKLHYAQSRNCRPCRSGVVPSESTTCSEAADGKSCHWWGSGAPTGEAVPRVTGGVQARRLPQHLGRVEMQRSSLGSGANTEERAKN